jgi:Zn-dependent protease with chaperone function
VFLFRGVTVSLAFYALVYCGLSILILSGWELAGSCGQNCAARRRADFLFVLRALPLIGAALFVLAFLVPSFVELEPRKSFELVGEKPLALASFGLLLLVIGTFNAFAAHWRTSRTVNGWLAGATLLDSHASVPVFRILPMVPALTLAGIRAPNVLLSKAAANVLTSAELDAALRHEMAHVRRFDNLKKLVFRFCAFPGSSHLEAAWSEAAEMTADDAAVTNARDAVELASALIKLSRLAQVQAPAPLTTPLAQRATPSINGRVQRLMEWKEGRSPAPAAGAVWYSWGSVAGLALTIVPRYGAILHGMHTLTEWMVR